MTGPRERLLLLCCRRTGSARPLSAAEYYHLRRTYRALPDGGPPEDPLSPAALTGQGYAEPFICRVQALLAREAEVAAYLGEAARRGIWTVTLHDPDYPQALRAAGGPPCCFGWGERALLAGPFWALAGPREASPDRLQFARAVGAAAARAGFTLVTGGARGADQAAMEGCRGAGGRLVTFVPDDLSRRGRELRPGSRHAVLSADGWDCPFANGRAFQRNACIHALGERTYIAGAHCRRGGTWRGAVDNLRRRLSPVFVYRDGSEAAAELAAMGAHLTDLAEVLPPEGGSFEI